MLPRNVVARITGAMVLLMLGLLVAGFASGAGGVGIDIRSEYFFGDGPHSWGVVARVHGDDLANGLLAMAGGSATAMAAGGLLYLTLRQRPSALLAAGAIGLLASGALMLVGVGASYWVADLACQWIDAKSDEADCIADTAFNAVTLRFFALLVGLPLVLGSLIAFGLLVQRLSGLPRWLIAFPVTGGALLVISPVGFAGPGFALFLLASGLVLLSWLVVLSGRLMVRGIGADPQLTQMRSATTLAS